MLVRYNLNGIELNEEGFQKLSAEIALAPMGGNFPMPWGKERVQLYFGEVPLGEHARTDHYSQRIRAPAAAGRQDRGAGEPRVLRSLHRCQASRPGPQESADYSCKKLNARGNIPIIVRGGERDPVILVAFKAIDPVLRGQDGGFDSHTLPPTCCVETLSSFYFVPIGTFVPIEPLASRSIASL